MTARMIAVYAGIAVALAAAVLGGARMRDPHRTARTDMPPPANVKHPQPAVGAGSSFRAMRESLVSPVSVPSGAALAQAALEGAGTNEERDEARGRELDQQRREQVEAQFEADPPPVAESWRMSRTVSDVFAGLQERGVRLKAIDCRHRLCKIDLVFDTVNADIEVLNNLFARHSAKELNEFGAAMAPTREYLANGKVNTTVYYARYGLIEVFD